MKVGELVELLWRLQRSRRRTLNNCLCLFHEFTNKRRENGAGNEIRIVFCLEFSRQPPREKQELIPEDLEIRAMQGLIQACDLS